MRIVIATPFYPPEVGILGTYARGLEEAFTRQGHTVTVITFSTSLPSGVRHVVYFLRVLWQMPGAAFMLSLDTWSVGLPSFFATKLIRVPFLVRIGGDFLWESYLERTHERIRLSDFYASKHRLSFKERVVAAWLAYLLRYADVVFFNTNFQRALWQKAYDLSYSQVRILENQYPRVEPSRAAKKLFVSASREAAVKNGDTLTRAFGRAKQKYPDIELDTRTLPHDEHLQRLRAAYAVIIPALSEVGSNTAIEAVAAGKPFIMTDDTGTKERLEGCGLFIDTRSEDALADAIEQVLDPTEYERLSAAAAGFSFIRSWDDVAHDILGTV